MRGLGSGDVFPTLALSTVADGELRMPEWSSGSWAVVLVYRAHW